MEPDAAPPPRQTQGYLRTLFQERGLAPKNKLGQNFLVDLNLVDFIVRSAELTPADLILEVGTGTGSLTARLAAEAGAVLSVELDPSFHALAQETLGQRDNVTLLYADELKNKNQINPRLLAELERLRQERSAAQLKLVANLPYAVATPVIANLLLTELPWERMVVTVQWEIAERLTAAPGVKDYGALSVLVQSLADVEILRRLSPAVFWPRPQVDSAIVRIWPRPEKRGRIPNVQRLRVFLRELYAHRRKNLRGALVSFSGDVHDKAKVDAKLAELGIEGGVRAETLTVADHLRLCDVFSGDGAE
jgi:16S rRNA (adenine1518-N6/adenine1519-N6)-dimethyltransferase